MWVPIKAQAKTLEALREQQYDVIILKFPSGIRPAGVMHMSLFHRTSTDNVAVAKPRIAFLHLL